MKNIGKIRRLSQIVAAVFIDGYAIGFKEGRIFTGGGKRFCVPVLNCYSCPGAIGACPIGSLQAVLGSSKFNMSFYVLGLIMLFGVLLGRVVCGFLCPFGLVQDLLNKIPLKKINIPDKIDSPLRYLKYIVLIVMVIILPIFVTNKYGTAPPYFCEFICPAGTLEGGIPLLWLNENLRVNIGALFGLKLGILIFIIIASMSIYRPFCKYLCPLGAFYSFFNKISIIGVKLDKEKCTGCHACEKACPMQVKLTEGKRLGECISCMKCAQTCKKDAIRLGIRTKSTPKPADNLNL